MKWTLSKKKRPLLLEEFQKANIKMKRTILTILFLLLAVVLPSCNNGAKSPKPVVPTAEQFHPLTDTHTRMVHGQSVYVPIYSSIYNRYEGSLLHMTGILSIRNISPKSEIIISQVDYYDTNGKLIKKFINNPFSLGKMSSKDFVIPESDLSGGTGANFVVKWESEHYVAIPIIESVMIGDLGTKGFAFSSRGKEIESH